MSKLRAAAAAVAVSASGLAFIVSHEGLVNQAYPDPAHGWAVPTICVGHTATAQRGQWKSDEQCLALLEQDVAEHFAHVKRLTAPVRLTQGEVDSYTSFVFNVGPTKFASSTLRKKLLAGDRVGACHELTRWVFAGGKKLRGLVTRRSAERDLCLRDL